MSQSSCQTHIKEEEQPYLPITENIDILGSQKTTVSKVSIVCFRDYSANTELRHYKKEEPLKKYTLKEAKLRLKDKMDNYRKRLEVEFEREKNEFLDLYEDQINE